MLARRIGELRIKKGLSQSQLAEMLHVSASTIGMYEQGRRTPSIDMLVELSKAFDVSLDYLITGTDSVFVSPQSAWAVTSSSGFLPANRQFVI